MNRRTIYIIAGVLATIIIIASVASYYLFVAPSVSPEEQLWRTTFNGATSFTFDTFDPHQATTSMFETVMGNCYEGLVDLDPTTLQIVPELATSWTVSSDATTMTFNLRHGVKFHDGTDFNASAVTFNYQRVLRFPSGLPSKYVDAIKTFDVIDDYTVKVTLNYPFAALLSWFAGADAKIFISPTYINTKGDAALQWTECGTGPYKLSEWIPDVRATLVKFADYWKGWSEPAPGQVHIETINILCVPEASSQRMLLQAGDVDFANQILSTDWDALNATGNVAVTAEARGLYPMAVALDTTEAPFNDSRVRQAVAYAMDYQKLLDALPFESRVYQMLPESLIGAAPNITKYSLDLEKAKALMAEAGYNINQTTQITLIGYQARPDAAVLADVLKTSLAPLGFDVKIQMVTISLLVDAFGDSSKWDMLINRCGSFQDPDMVWQYYHSTEFMNLPHYNSSQVDNLLKLGRETGDWNMRKTYYQQIEEIENQALGWVQMTDYPMPLAKRTWLHGVEFEGLSGFFSFHIDKVWKQR